MPRIMVDGKWNQKNFGHIKLAIISAISKLSVLTNDNVLRERCIYIVKELNRYQEKIGTGYVSAWPTSYLDRVENIKVWTPYYTLHKILAGLLDTYNFCGDKLALTTAVNLVHYLHDRTIKLGDKQFQKVLDNTEQGVINEVLWNIYAETGDAKSKELRNSSMQKQTLIL